MTAVGGMLLLASGTSESTGLIPDSPSHWMGAIATALSFVNIIGGFLITTKMLELFRRPDDPKDYFEFYVVPSALLLAGLGGAYLVGSGNFENVSGSVAIAAAVCCISASEFLLCCFSIQLCTLLSSLMHSLVTSCFCANLPPHQHTI